MSNIKTHERVRMVECEKKGREDVLEHDIIRGGVVPQSFFTCEFTTDSEEGDVTELQVHTFEYVPDGGLEGNVKTGIVPDGFIVDFNYYNKGTRATCDVSKRYPLGISVYCRDEELDE